MDVIILGFGIAVSEAEAGKQYTLWADIDIAPRSHIEKAFSQRRQQTVGDCNQLSGVAP